MEIKLSVLLILDPTVSIVLIHSKPDLRGHHQYSQKEGYELSYWYASNVNQPFCPTSFGFYFSELVINHPSP